MARQGGVGPHGGRTRPGRSRCGPPQPATPARARWPRSARACAPPPRRRRPCGPLRAARGGAEGAQGRMAVLARKGAGEKKSTNNSRGGCIGRILPAGALPTRAERRNNHLRLVLKLQLDPSGRPLQHRRDDCGEAMLVFFGAIDLVAWINQCQIYEGWATSIPSRGVAWQTLFFRA